MTLNCEGMATTPVLETEISSRAKEAQRDGLTAEGTEEQPPAAEGHHPRSHSSTSSYIILRLSAQTSLQNVFNFGSWVEVYYESIKRELKIRGINKCRCDERLQTKTKEFTRLPYTGLVLELEHLKIETRLIRERFANAMGECEN